MIGAVRVGGLKVGIVPRGRALVVNVTAFGKPLAPGVSVKVKVAGLPAFTVWDPAVAVNVKSMPVPLRVTVCVEPATPPTSSVIVSVAGPRVPVAPGVNVTLITQVPPEPETLAPLVHVVPEATAKSLAFVPEMPTAFAAARVSLAPPLLVIVMVCALLATFTP